MEEEQETPNWKIETARRLEVRGVPPTEVIDHDPGEDLPTLMLERAYRVEQAIRRYLSRVDDLPPEEVRLPSKVSDRFRLLNLYAWSLRYRVDLPFILDTLLQKRFLRIRQGNGGLGVNVGVLCSRGSQKFLEEVLLEAPEHQQPALERNLMPVCNGTHSSSASMITYYAETMRDRHREALHRETVVFASPRNWRGKTT